MRALFRRYLASLRSLAAARCADARNVLFAYAPYAKRCRHMLDLRWRTRCGCTNTRALLLRAVPFMRISARRAGDISYVRFLVVTAPFWLLRTAERLRGNGRRYIFDDVHSRAWLSCVLRCARRTNIARAKSANGYRRLARAGRAPLLIPRRTFLPPALPPLRAA